MAGPATTSLTDQVACVDTVNEDLLERVRHEVLTVPTGWQKEYGQYQSGARLSQLTARAELLQASARKLPSLDDSDVDRHSNTAFNLASLGYVSTAEQYLLRLFYAHALPEGRLYDLIIALHRCRADHGAVEAWQSRKALMLGHPLNSTPKGDSP